MRVLLVNTSEHTGGASIAAKRLMKALNQNGVEARLLVRDRLTDQPEVIALPRSPWLKLRFVLERLEIFLLNRFSKDHLFAIDPAFHGNDITKLPAFKEADVIHLHWINQGMLSLGDIRKILKSASSQPRSAIASSRPSVAPKSSTARRHSRSPRAGQLTCMGRVTWSTTPVT